MRRNIIWKEDWWVFAFLLVMGGWFVAFLIHLARYGFEHWTQFLGFPFFLFMCGGSWWLWNAVTRVRLCPKCHVPMAREPAAASGGKVMVRCPRCGTRVFTGVTGFGMARPPWAWGQTAGGGRASREEEGRT